MEPRGQHKPLLLRNNPHRNLFSKLEAPSLAWLIRRYATLADDSGIAPAP